MKSLKYTLILFLITVAQAFAFGQRQWGINDSTFYQINADTTVIAARYKLYLKVQNNISVVYDFTDLLDSTNFIRDFDFFDAKNWYVLVGSRYIGYTTRLYKTIDGGNNWAIDSSYIGKSNQNSVNQVQVIDSSTIFLFDGYYFSRLIYSENMGHQWFFWFESPFAYYHGLFICEGRYYVYGFEGDAFNSYMFEIPDWLFLQTEVSDFNSNCPGSINPDCYYAPSNISKPEAYNLFKAELQEICDFSGIGYDIFLNREVWLYPNPAGAVICIGGLDTMLHVQLLDTNGTLLRTEMTHPCLELYDIPSGIYFLRLYHNNKTTFQKFVKK